MKIEVDCPNCEGEGKIDFSCCGDDMRGSAYEDIRICPSCHEHLGDPEECIDCKSTGKIEIEAP